MGDVTLGLHLIHSLQEEDFSGDLNSKEEQEMRKVKPNNFGACLDVTKPLLYQNTKKSFFECYQVSNYHFIATTMNLVATKKVIFCLLFYYRKKISRFY